MANNKLSPLFAINNGYIFHLNGKNFSIVNDAIEEAETVPAEFAALVQALKIFSITESEIIWHKGITKISYNLNENKYYVGKTEVATSDTLRNFLFAAGIIRIEESNIANSFSYLAENISKIISIDFVESIKEGDINIDVLRAGNNVYISRMNEANKIYKFFKANNANSALEYITEQTGINHLDLVADLLEGAAAESASVRAEILEKRDLIAFLKESKEKLANANRSIVEIKEANDLINGEISKFEAEIKELEVKL
jgi:hypothetical protein